MEVDTNSILFMMAMTPFILGYLFCLAVVAFIEILRKKKQQIAENNAEFYSFIDSLSKKELQAVREYDRIHTKHRSK